MPLDKSALRNGLESLFKRPPFPESDCARSWANAMSSYASAIVPASTSVATATNSLAGALAGMSAPGAAAQIFETAFKAFATQVGVGMAPAFTATPPPADVGFASVFATASGDAAGRAGALADAIDTWMRTGTAALSSPPGTVSNWT